MIVLPFFNRIFVGFKSRCKIFLRIDGVTNEILIMEIINSKKDLNEPIDNQMLMNERIGIILNILQINNDRGRYT